MKENILTVIIQKSIQEVFEFTTNPQNTSKWIDSIQIEESNEWPPKIGTIYKSRGNSNSWSIYKVSKYLENQEFELVKIDSSTYQVNYSYSAISDQETRLVYREWVTKGKIEELFTQEILGKLKTVLEKN